MKQVLFLIASLSAGNALAARSTVCQPVTMGAHSETENVYRFPAQTICKITGVTAADYPNVYRAFLAAVRLGSQAIHSDQGTALSRKIDSTARYVSSNGVLTMRSLVTLAAVEHEEFAFNRVTTKFIGGTGNIKYTRFVQVTMQLEADAADPAAQSFRVTQITDIERPPLAPVGLFVRRAKEGIKNDLEKFSQEQVSLAAVNL